MKKLILTLVIGLFFVAFSNAQTAETKKEVKSTYTVQKDKAADATPASCAGKKADKACAGKKAKGCCAGKNANKSCADKKAACKGKSAASCKGKATKSCGSGKAKKMACGSGKCGGGKS